jgi:SAM-dependent methyltransferase
MINTRSYSFNSDLKIWETPAHNGTAYSDGDSVELRLLAVLQQCSDLSTASEELRNHITDWPSEYHLSSTRHNLLRPFSLGASDCILELGCGCGAMTRYLGECGANVVAVEGSRRRAMITAERCRDLPNVSVYCDNLIDFQPNQLFDLVTLIGVLEYAHLFIPGPNPVQACLERAGTYVGENGTVVLAIENQLGLKYFNGCSEDHTGTPYFGINDLYNPKTPVTFGRQELKSRLHAAGFADVSFFYPFPDYKLPDIILSDEAFERPDFQVADLLFRSFSRDYDDRGYRAFHENLAWQPLSRNGLMRDFANSFLVNARKSRPAGLNSPEWLARIYSTKRLPVFATETVFTSSGAAITVSKYPVFPLPSHAKHIKDSHFHHQPQSRSAYVSGRLYGAELQPIMARGGGPEEVARWAAPWVNRLVTEALPGPEGIRVLPGTRLDSIPANIVRDLSDALVDIDLEWEADAPIPLPWVLVRGLFIALTTCPLSPAFSGLTFSDAISKVLDDLGQPLSAVDYRIAAEFEDALQTAVCGQNRRALPFAEVLTQTLYSTTSLPTFHQEIIGLHKEIARIKATASWRVTKPLRLLAFISRHLSAIVRTLLTPAQKRN